MYKCSTGLNTDFITLTQPMVAIKPCKSPIYDPAMGQQFEAICVVGKKTNGPVNTNSLRYPSAKLFATIAAIDPNALQIFADAGE